MIVDSEPSAHDSDLVHALTSDRQADAIATLIRRYGPAVYASARRQTGDAGQAADVAQAVFVLLLRRSPAIRRPELLAGWLMKATRNCALTSRRTARRRAMHETAAAAVQPASSATPTPAAEVERAELLSRLDRVLAGLPEVDRALVTRAYLQSQAVEQIGVALGMRGPAVRKRLARAIGKMRGAFARDGLSVTSAALVAHLQQLPAHAPPDDLTDAVLAAATPGAAAAATVIARSVARREASKVIVVAGTCLTACIAVAAAFLWVELTRGAPGPSPATPTGRPADAGVRSGPRVDVYHSDFAHGTAGWSSRSVAYTPVGHLPYLGPFRSGAVRLPINGLLPHRALHIQADLFIMGSWDGTGKISAARSLNGPCFVTFGLDDGRPPVVHSTFTDQFDEYGFAYASLIQTYPSVAPDYPRVMGTGAAAVRSLGVIESFWNGRKKFPADCVFHFDVTLPHSDDSVAIQWVATGLKGNDKSWGLADVKVEALSTVPTPTHEQLDQWWQDAVTPDPVPARAAFLKLLAADEATVAYLRQRPEPPPFNTRDVTARLPAVASADAFDARRDLVAMGPGVEALLTARPELTAELDTREGQALVAINDATELRPIEAAPLRAAAVKAKLLAQIASPAAQQALVDWLDAGPAWQSDLTRRFESDYQLKAGRVVRYVTSPDRAARAEYLRRRAQVYALAPRGSRNLFDTPPPDGPVRPMTFTVVDEVPDLFSPLSADPATHSAPASLPSVVHQLSDAALNNSAWTHVSVPKELRSVELPGDWIVRFRTPQTRVLEELAKVLSKQLGRPVSIPLVPSDGAVTSTLIDDPTTRPSSTAATGETTRLDVYTDAADRALPGREFGVPNAQYIGYQLEYGRTIRIRPTSDNRPYNVIVHPHADRELSRDEAMEPDNVAFIDGVLDHLAEQLGMRRENHPLNQPVYRITIGP